MASALLARTRDAETFLVERLVACATSSSARVLAPPSWRAVSRCRIVWTMVGHGLGAREAPLPH